MSWQTPRRGRFSDGSRSQFSRLTVRPSNMVGVSKNKKIFKVENGGNGGTCSYRRNAAEIPAGRIRVDIVHHLSGLRAFFAKRVAICDVDGVVREVALRLRCAGPTRNRGIPKAICFRSPTRAGRSRAARSGRHRAQHGELEERTIRRGDLARARAGKPEQLALLMAALQEAAGAQRQIFVLPSIRGNELRGDRPSFRDIRERCREAHR